jgi:hypothetical protein
MEQSMPSIYIPASLADARVAAMRLRTQLPSLTPSMARNAIARMMGAADWSALRAVVTDENPTASAPDRAVDPTVRTARRNAQTAALVPFLQEMALDLNPEVQLDPTQRNHAKLLAQALVDEVHVSEPELTPAHAPIEWAKRPLLMRTDLLAKTAGLWWLRWRKAQVVGDEAAHQIPEDSEAVERFLEIEVGEGCPSAFLRLARGWGELVTRPGAGEPPPDEAIAFVFDRLAVEYACERARRADAWRDFNEKRSQLPALERDQLEIEFDRQLWSMARALLNTQPCTRLAELATHDPPAFRELAHRGRSRFEPGLRAFMQNQVKS